MAISDQPWYSWYQPLFNLMSREHNVTLLQSEMDEIIYTVKEMLKKDYQMTDIERSFGKNDISEETAQKLIDCLKINPELQKYFDDQEKALKDWSIQASKIIKMSALENYQLYMYSFFKFDINQPLNRVKFIFFKSKAIKEMSLKHYKLIKLLNDDPF